MQSLPHAGSAGGEAGGGDTAGGNLGGVSTRAGQQPAQSHCSDVCSKSHVKPSSRNWLHGLPLHCARHWGSDGDGGAASATAVKTVWFDTGPSMQAESFTQSGRALLFSLRDCSLEEASRPTQLADMFVSALRA